jgi:hypothetical protein
MSIQESKNSIKSLGDQMIVGNGTLLEGDFDIVPVGEGQGERASRGTFLFYALVLVLIGTASFGLGRLSVKEASVPVAISVSAGVENNEKNVSVPITITDKSSTIGEVKGAEDGAVVASKTGKRYHYPWCAGAKQIAEKNKITFSSIKKAREAGYTPAANCKGLP